MASRNELSLKERVSVIEYAQKNPKTGTRKIAEVFKCGRTQIQSILKNREALLSEYEANAPASRERHRRSSFEDVTLGRREEGLLLVQSIKWLVGKRHNLRQFAVSGEARCC